MTVAPEKADVLRAIDSEIMAASERERLAGMSSWAIAGAFVVLSGMAATLWEANHIRWIVVAELFLTFTLVAELLANIVSSGRFGLEHADTDLILWAAPRRAIFAQRLVVISLTLVLSARVPWWSTVLAFVTFGSQTLFALLA